MYGVVVVVCAAGIIYVTGDGDISGCVHSSGHVVCMYHGVEWM